jgi:glutamate dehydrogenase (NAD(P)+)
MATAYLEEVNPWQAQVLRSDLAAKKLKLHEGLWKILRKPSREVIVHVPVQMDNGTLEVLRRASATIAKSESAKV